MLQVSRVFCITAKMRADVTDGSKPEKLNASKCFPLFPESGHRAMQSACPFVPRTDMTASLDHLVGAGEKRG
jgi:hypothetical protein